MLYGNHICKMESKEVVGILEQVLTIFREGIKYISDFASEYLSISSQNVSDIILILISLFIAWKIMLMFYVTTKGRKWYFIIIALVLFLLLRYL